MKQFISFVKKEFYHIFRDKRTIFILLVMPAIQIIMFGFAITTELKNTKVAIFDPSKDAASSLIIERLEASEYFTISRILTAPNQINDIFRDGKIGLVVVFNENFADNLYKTGEASVQLVSDGTDPNQAQMLTNYASAIIGSCQAEFAAGASIPYQIVSEVRMLYNPQQRSALNFVPGVMGMILMLICAMMTSIAIVREKEMGTMEVLLASPLKPIYIILAKAVPFFFISILNLITILLLSAYVLEIPITGSLFWLIVVSLIFILLSLCMGLLVSTFVSTQRTAILVSGMVFIAPIMILSGMIFPVESMPETLQYISAGIPARWYIDAVKKLMIQGVEVQFIIKEIVILSVTTVGLIIACLKKFNTRLC